MQRDKENTIWPISLFLLCGIFMVHHKLIEELWRQDFRTYLWVIDSVYKTTLASTCSFPLWQNYLLCGVSYIANAPFLFSVARLLTLAGVSSVFAWFISEYIFMAAGTICFFLLMRLYKCSRYVSVLGALMFQFFFYRFGTSEGYPLALAAVIFLLCEKYEESPNLGYIILGAISVGIACLSGIIHGIAFVLLFQAVLAVYYMLNKIHRNYCAAVIFSWTTGIILALPVLLVQMRDAADSQRIFYQRYQMTFGTFNISELVYQLNTSLHLRDFFPVSLICCILAVIAIFYIKEKKVLGFYFVSLFTVFLCVFLSVTQGLWKGVPLIGKCIVGFDIMRGICLIWFSAAFLSTYAVNSMIDNYPLKNLKKFIVMCALLAVIGFGFICLPYMSKGSIAVRAAIFLFILANLYLKDNFCKRINIIFAILLVLALASTFLRDYVKICSMLRSKGFPLIGAIFSEAALNKNMDLLPGETSVRKSEIVEILKKSSDLEYYRSVSIGVDTSYNEVKFLSNRIYSPLGMANIYPARYYEFFKWLIDDLRTRNPKRYNFFVNEQAYPYEMGGNYNENLLSLAGVKYIISPNTVKENRFRKILSGDKYSLYMNQSVLPRAFAVFDAKILKTKAELSGYMMNAGVDSFTRSVPMLGADATGLSLASLNNSAGGSARIIKYSPNEVLIDADFSGNGLLVLTDNFHKSWKAFVDNAPAKVYPAYYTFRMVEVPKGRHLIRFYFRDGLFIRFSIVSLAVLFFMILIPVVKWRLR